MSVEKARAVLQEVLRHAFDERLPVRASPRGDGWMDLRVEQRTGSQRLVGHWARGWPSDVRALLARVGQPWPRDHVILSARFSPGAIALLDSVGANWGDASGRARIRTSGGMAIRIDDREAAAADPRHREARFAWSPARADVAEALLTERVVPRLEVLKRLTGWSVPQVGQTLRAFDHQGWTVRAGSARGTGATRELAGWEPMLESWAAYVAETPRQSIGAHATYRDPLSYVETTLVEAWKDLHWAASGWAGLQLTRPFVTSVPRLHLYVDAEHFHDRLPVALRKAGLREVSEGARVEIWLGRRAVFLGSAVGPTGVRVVHAIRLYADLLTMGDRGGEAALHVREELLDRG